MTEGPETEKTEKTGPGGRFFLSAVREISERRLRENLRLHPTHFSHFSVALYCDSEYNKLLTGIIRYDRREGFCRTVWDRRRPDAGREKGRKAKRSGENFYEDIQYDDEKKRGFCSHR